MHGQGHGRRPRPRATPRLREPSLARGVGVVHASTRAHGAGPPSLRPRVPRPPSPHHLAARSRPVVEPAHAGCPSGASPGGGREATASGDAPGRADTANKPLHPRRAQPRSARRDAPRVSGKPLSLQSCTSLTRGVPHVLGPQPCTTPTRGMPMCCNRISYAPSPSRLACPQ